MGKNEEISDEKFRIGVGILIGFCIFVVGSIIAGFYIFFDIRGVVAGILIAIVGAIVFFLFCRKYRQREEEESFTENGKIFQ